MTGIIDYGCGNLHSVAQCLDKLLPSGVLVSSTSKDNVQKVLETNTSGAASTADNRMTLFTCVRNERDYRWQVQAVEVSK